MLLYFIQLDSALTMLHMTYSISHVYEFMPAKRVKGSARNMFL